MPTRRDFISFAGASTLAAATAKQGSATAERFQKPNILLLFPDQHRFDWLGGNPDLPLRTPNLNALAERGAQFNHAVCPSPVCAPSRACLASGMEYDRCGVPNNGKDYPLDQLTFYQMLREAGYATLGCGKFDLHKPTHFWGLDGRHLIEEWGFSDGIDNAGKWDAINSGKEAPQDPYMAYLHDHGLVDVHVNDFLSRRKIERGGFAATFPTPLPDPAYCDNWIGQNGLQLIRRVPAGHPWFMQVNFTGPHDPMDITHGMAEHYRGVDFPQPNGNDQLPPEKHVEIRQNYSAMVENIDRWVGVYIDELERRGELENTLIVFSSDHGEMLGDHNLWAKTQPYEPSVGVPFIAAGPNVAKGRQIDSPVMTLDLAATCIEAAGLKTPQSMDSRSLWPVLKGDEDRNRDYVLSGLGSWRMVRDERYKLVVNYGKDKHTMLFDMIEDPLENNNLAESLPSEVKRMNQLLG